MKTFINVLYRRILYRIPLKFLLLLLAVCAVFIACFSNAEGIYNFTDTSFRYVYNNLNNTYTFDGVFCLFLNSNCSSNCGTISAGGQTVDLKGSWGGNGPFCTDVSPVTIAGVSSEYYNVVVGDTLLETFHPQYTSLQCQTEYNLIPISSVDQNYCTTNNLCPSCPTCPSGGSGRSNVYINDILHVGAPNIVMNISEEIDWDYEYTAGGNNMNIDVVGYNVDYEKIGEIIDNQNYKPSSEDFKNILGILAPYTRIIVFFVFLFLVWAWIKKPFKSKKL